MARRDVLTYAIFPLLYLGAVLLGRNLLLADSTIAMVWPAAGVAVIWMMRCEGTRRLLCYLVMYLLTVVPSMLTGMAATMALTSSLVHCLQCLAIVGLLERWPGRGTLVLRGPRDLGVLTFVSALGALVAGVLLIPAEIASGVSEPVYWTLGFAMRNLTGVVIAAAFLHLALQPTFLPVLGQDLRRPDLVPMLLCLGFAVFVLFGHYQLALTFSIIPIFIWVSLRFSTPLTLATLAVTVTSMALITLHGSGPFGQVQPWMRLFTVQSASLVLAGLAGTLSLFRDEGVSLLREVNRAHVETKQTAARLADSEKVFRTLFTGAPVGIITTTAPGAGPIRITDANDSVEAMIRRRGGLVGQPISSLVKRQDVVEFVATAREAAATGETMHVDVLMNVAETDVVARLSITRVEPSVNDPFLVVTIVDVTGAHHEREQLSFIAHHDQLTGLANRSHFEARLAELLADPLRQPNRLGLLYLDLDGFKAVNDTAGHAAGDAVLRVTARRLLGGVRGSELVARLGGDEFAVIAPNTSLEGLAALASRLRRELAEPISTDFGTFTVGASIGTAIQQPGEGAAALVHRVDEQMYRVKLATKVEATRRR